MFYPLNFLTNSKAFLFLFIAASDGSLKNSCSISFAYLPVITGVSFINLLSKFLHSFYFLCLILYKSFLESSLVKDLFRANLLPNLKAFSKSFINEPSVFFTFLHSFLCTILSMRIPHKLPIILYIVIIPPINSVMSKINIMFCKKLISKNLLVINPKFKNKTAEKYKVIYISRLVFLCRCIGLVIKNPPSFHTLFQILIILEFLFAVFAPDLKPVHTKFLFIRHAIVYNVIITFATFWTHRLICMSQINCPVAHDKNPFIKGTVNTVAAKIAGAKTVSVFKYVFSLMPFTIPYKKAITLDKNSNKTILSAK